MGNEELRDFLTQRRARLSPEEVGLPPCEGLRRVPGLRRSEVAMLAGISVGYYKRLERGVVRSVSDSVVEAMGRALQLDDAERAHLVDLLRRPEVAARSQTMPRAVLPFTRQLLDGLSLPGCVVDDTLDVLAANDVGRALYEPLYRSPAQPVNHARFAFLDPVARQYWTDWDAIADLSVSILRATQGRRPHDGRLTSLVDELRDASPDFRSRWAAHSVASDTSGIKRIHHPLVGDLTLHSHSLPLPEEPGHRLLVHTAVPESVSDTKLEALAGTASGVTLGERWAVGAESSWWTTDATRVLRGPRG